MQGSALSNLTTLGVVVKSESNLCPQTHTVGLSCACCCHSLLLQLLIFSLLTDAVFLAAIQRTQQVDSAEDPHRTILRRHQERRRRGRVLPHVPYGRHARRSGVYLWGGHALHRFVPDRHVSQCSTRPRLLPLYCCCGIFCVVCCC